MQRKQVDILPNKVPLIDEHITNFVSWLIYFLHVPIRLKREKSSINNVI